MKRKIKLWVKQKIINHLPNWFSQFSRLVYLNATAKKRLQLRDKLRFDVHLTDHCNLNCKGCLHFSPLSHEKYLDIGIFEKDCKKLSQLTSGTINDICLLGGEPLLHPNLVSILRIVRHYFPNGRINVLSNGILLPKQSESFWAACKENNIDVSVSYYPIIIDVEEIKRLASQYNVALEIRDEYRNDKSTWLRQPLDLEGRQSSIKSHSTCAMANYCIQLVDGKLYQCETVAYIHYFNEYFDKNLQVTEKDYIDIHSVKDVNEILNFLCKAIPFCRYCKMQKIEYVGWDHSKKEITEWV